MPKVTFDSLDAVPEGLKDIAKDEGGKFVVDVVGAAKLAEFRDNNIKIAQERDALKAYRDRLAPVVGDDIDGFVTSLQEMSGIVTQVKDGKLKGTEAIEAEVNNRVASMKTGFETQLAEANQRLNQAVQVAGAADQRYRRSIVDQAITAAVIDEQSGALPTALPDILARAYNVFQVTDDGKVVAKDGDAIIYGADGASPMTPTEWVTGRLRESASHFFKNSNGGGAAGGGNAGDARYGGMSETDFRKLTPHQKLTLANSARK